MLRETVTEQGRVRGVVGTDARITVYKGIPYAADTSGDNRWRAPQPGPKWEGVRDCSEFGPITVQAVPGKDPNAFYSKEWHVDPEVPMGEDGLRLNIWTPAKSADEKLPVFVWFFGGAFKEGYAHEMEFDGERLASRGIIYVSVAYRVNIFGFLCHPDLVKEAPEAPANFGMLDQRAGLEWVIRNIANFGGDPGNITIGGQSAGGGSVWNHLTSPGSRNLFQKAIIQSAGGLGFRYPKSMFGFRSFTFEDAQQNGAKFLKEVLGCDTIAEARKLDAREIEEKVLATGAMFGPIVDGKFMLQSQNEAILKDELPRIPILIGNTTNEFMNGPAADDEETIVKWAQDSFGEYADEYLDICRRMAKETGESLRKVATVGTFELGSQLALECFADQKRDIHYYIFGPTIPGDDAGAFHSSDLWFMSENLLKCWRPFDGHHFDLARKMANYWANFVKTGDPNGNDKDGTPMLHWDPFTAEDRCNIFFGDEVVMDHRPYTEKRKFLLRVNDLREKKD